MTSTARTAIALAKYRSAHQPDQPMNPDARRYAGDTDQMGSGDGLLRWVDGPVGTARPQPDIRPELDQRPDGLRLWVVTADDVLHALEACDFGTKREAGAVKHSNLTGGGRAFVGGEMVFIDAATIAITGSSGRYRLRAAGEMEAVERSFVESGYHVWSMGYDQDTNRPNIFGLSDLEWVSP